MHLLATNISSGDLFTRSTVLLRPFSDLHPDSLVGGHTSYSSGGVNHTLLEFPFVSSLSHDVEQAVKSSC